MGFLEKVAEIKGGIFWCHRGATHPDARIHQIVERHRGRLVPIHGFDELMLQLGEKLTIPDPRPSLQKTHESRVAAWQKQFGELNKKLTEPAASPAIEAELKPVREAAAAAVERLTKEKDWWAWELKAKAEKDPAKVEAIYREGLKDFPESAELTGNFALFMQNIWKDDEEAERLYRRALELDPKDAVHRGNFANFLWKIRKDYEEAERLYRRALELDPKQADNTGNFALFMEDIQKDYEEAERLYRRALELNPKHANHTGNFAEFQWQARQNYDEAERLYRRALELDPDDAYHLGQFATFLWQVRQDFAEAAQLYERSVKLEPPDDDWKAAYEEFQKKRAESPEGGAK